MQCQMALALCMHNDHVNCMNTLAECTLHFALCLSHYLLCHVYESNAAAYCGPVSAAM